jgi:three-Cys-motif partner protein
LYDRLSDSVREFPFAEAVQGSISEHIGRIRRSAGDHTVFLYLDPFTVEGLDWQSIDSVLKHIQQSDSSIELLLNFNAPSFVRRGLSALKLPVPSVDPVVEDDDEADPMRGEPAALDSLHRAVGRNDWVSLLDAGSFQKKVDSIAVYMYRRFKTRFREACYVGVRAKRSHLIPKYFMIFGSRNSDALELMNDEMVKAAGGSELCFDLFARDDLAAEVLRLCDRRMQRGELILEVMRQHFCAFKRADIRGAIEQQLKDGKLASGTGKVRINDSVHIWRVQSSV